MTERLLRISIAVSIAVLVLVVSNCTGTLECYQCDGPYDTDVCGLNFNVDTNDTVTCDGPCITTSIHRLNNVSRGCADNETHIGCFFVNIRVNSTYSADMLKCNNICNKPLCNGPGVLPARKCFSCQGSYTSSCGWDFNNELMIQLGNTIECEQTYGCYTTATSTTGKGLDTVWRGCRTSNSSTHIGCFFQTVSGGDQFTCNNACSNVDYCNGFGVIPQKNPPAPTAYPKQSSVGTESFRAGTRMLTLLLLTTLCINSLWLCAALN